MLPWVSICLGFGWAINRLRYTSVAYTRDRGGDRSIQAQGAALDSDWRRQGNGEDRDGGVLLRQAVQDRPEQASEWTVSPASLPLCAARGGAAALRTVAGWWDSR